MTYNDLRYDIHCAILSMDYMSDMKKFGSPCIMAIDDTLVSCINSHKPFTVKAYLQELREYDLPLCYIADFIFNLMDILEQFETGEIIETE